MYWNSTSSNLWVYNGSAWEQATLTAGDFLSSSDIGVTVQGYDADTTTATNTQTLTNKTLASPIIDGGLTEDVEVITSSSNAATIDLSLATNFTHTLTENVTYTFSNPATSGKSSAFTLKVVQDASASGFTVTWDAAVDWAAATAPTLTADANGVDYFVFITTDGGTTYYGFVAGKGMA